MKSLSYPEWLDMELWQEYKKHRVKLKRPMTEYAETLNIEKLERIMKTGFTQQEIINNVIEMCWQGIYAPRNRNLDPPKQPYIADTPTDTNGTEKYRDMGKLTKNIKEIP